MHKNSTRKNYDYKYGQKNIFNKIEEHFKVSGRIQTLKTK
jgi:hypothetical protein